MRPRRFSAKGWIVEVLLTNDVPSLGLANEVVNVKDGYARNYLLPNRMAILATDAIKIERASKIGKALERKKERMSVAQELADRMSRLTLVFTRKSSDEGRLFGSVTKSDIADLLQKDHSIEIDKRSLYLPQALKQVGISEVKIRLEAGVSAYLSVSVGADEEVQIKEVSVPVVSIPDAKEQAKGEGSQEAEEGA
jgi:large subunit ribosomal protein L9